MTTPRDPRTFPGISVTGRTESKVLNRQWIWLFIRSPFLTGDRNRLGALLTWWLASGRDIRRERTWPSAAGQIRVGSSGREPRTAAR
jgi:hypothetical protein